MKSRTGVGLALAGCIVLAAACAAEPTPPAVSAPPPPAASPPPPPLAATTPAPAPRPAPAPPPAKTPDTHAWESDWPKGWTDPRVVAALADSCSFAPVSPPPDPGGGIVQPADIFACTLEFEQACMPSACSEEQDACKHDCESTCSSCSAGCSATCGTCEASCKDAACRTACATATAACKQACGRTLDRCSTGGCNKGEAACSALHAKIVQANHCQARCDGYNKCRHACPGEGAPGPCMTACDEAIAPGYDACVSRCDAGPGSKYDHAHCRRVCGDTAKCTPQVCNDGA